MASMTLFDDLADLTLVEVFSYLSNIDVLCAFSCLNRRLTALLVERGFLRRINWPSMRHRRCDSLLTALSFNEIETLVINDDTSPLQLTRWIYIPLPRLTTLELRGVRNLTHVSSFLLSHATTLMNLTIVINCRFAAISKSSKCRWTTLVENVVLRQLPALRSLDLGTEQRSHLKCWNIPTMPMSLTYLRVVLSNVDDLLRVMSTQPLSDTLCELHTRVGDTYTRTEIVQTNLPLQPRMTHLNTFTFAEFFYYGMKTDWTIIEALTSSSVMPVLRRANLAIVIGVDDLDRIGQSSLFTDDRRVDVHFALCLNNGLPHIELSKHVPHGSRFHQRKIISATFLGHSWVDDLIRVGGLPYFREGRQDRQHLWYTLPWVFDEFINLTVNDDSITEMQTFRWPSTTTVIGRSRLLKLEASRDVIPPLIVSLPQAVSLNHIVELHLSDCKRPIRVTLPALRHLTLMNSLEILNINSLLPPSIRSIQIVLSARLPFVTPHWVALQTLAVLPVLSSLRLLLYDMELTLDNTTSQIIAETVPMLTDFALLLQSHRDNVEAVLNKQCMFIKNLRSRILALTLEQPSYDIVQQDETQLTIWR